MIRKQVDAQFPRKLSRYSSHPIIPMAGAGPENPRSCPRPADSGRTETDASPMHTRSAELYPRIRPQAAV